MDDFTAISTASARTTESVPEPLRSPGAHRELKLDGDNLICPEKGRVGRRIGPVWPFMDVHDPFYEGKYNNRVRFVPKSDSYFATLPLRIVSLNFPLTVAAEVSAGSTVLEIGCAAGIVWFGQRYQMVGLDLSEEALHIAAENYGLVVQGSGTDLPIADRSIDAVISSYVFEHLTVEQKQDLLSECMRVLKPGGKVIFLYDQWTDNPVITYYRRQDPEKYQRLFLDGDGHLGYATVDENRAHFRAAGLRIDREVFYESTPMLSNSVWTKFSNWPGWRGTVGWIGAALTSGPLKLPMLALMALTDATVGRLLPARYARVLITVASKP